MNTVSDNGAHGKWTPGPWNVTIARNGHVSIYPQGGLERVADVYCPLDRDTPDTLDGNARLISAAPDMAEALQAVLLRLDMEPVDAIFPCSAMRETIRAALAKAGVR